MNGTNETQRRTFVLVATVFGIGAIAGCGSGAEEGAVASASAAIGPGFVLTPAGPVHQSCLHHLLDGDVVEDGGDILHVDGTRESVARCAFANPLHSPGRAASSGEEKTDNGWIEAAWWDAPNSVGYYFAQFVVPRLPKTYKGQDVTLFSALEDQNANNIIQPTISYGDFMNADSGDSWDIQSEYGGDNWGGNYYAPDGIRVAAGEVITGIIKGDPGNCTARGCLWTVTTSNGQKTSSISVRTRISWRWVLGGVLEAYGVKACDEYPATSEGFYGAKVRPWNSGAIWRPSWSTAIYKRTCGERISYSLPNNQGDVALSY